MKHCERERMAISPDIASATSHPFFDQSPLPPSQYVTCPWRSFPRRLSPPLPPEYDIPPSRRGIAGGHEPGRSRPSVAPCHPSVLSSIPVEGEVLFPATSIDGLFSTPALQPGCACPRCVLSHRFCRACALGIWGQYIEGDQGGRMAFQLGRSGRPSRMRTIGKRGDVENQLPCGPAVVRGVDFRISPVEAGRLGCRAERERSENVGA